MNIYTIIYLFNTLKPPLSAKPSNLLPKPSNHLPPHKKQLTALTSLTTPINNKVRARPSPFLSSIHLEGTIVTRRWKYCYSSVEVLLLVAETILCFTRALTHADSVILNSRRYILVRAVSAVTASPIDKIALISVHLLQNMHLF